MRERQIRQILADICADIDTRQARAAATGVAFAAAVALSQGCIQTSVMYATPSDTAYGAPQTDAASDARDSGAGLDSQADAAEDATGADTGDSMPSSDATTDTH